MTSGERTVHLVDDDPAVLDSLSLLLRAAGFTVEAHATADGFLAALDGTGDGCVLLDLRMPGVDGLEVLRRLGSLGFALPVILMTGDVETPPVDVPGVFAVLEKPLDDEQLIECVQRALAEAGAPG